MINSFNIELLDSPQKRKHYFYQRSKYVNSSVEAKCILELNSIMFLSLAPHIRIMVTCSAFSVTFIIKYSIPVFSIHILSRACPISVLENMVTMDVGNSERHN